MSPANHRVEATAVCALVSTLAVGSAAPHPGRWAMYRNRLARAGQSILDAQMSMMTSILLLTILLLAMLLPYLPGRFDASAATLSFLAQVASYLSLLLAPIGIAWIASRRWSKQWRKLTIVILSFIALLTAIAAISVNQLSIGVIVGVGAIACLRILHRRMTALSADENRDLLPFCLVLIPVLLVTFISVAVPRAAAWSRGRAIQHSVVLIEEIESFRQRRGHYPVSLQSLNRDVPTGVMGIERFHYEPNGEAYNLFFVRPSDTLDAKEVVMFNPRDEHRFTSHELDLLQYDGEQLNLRRGDRRRTQLDQLHWISILFD